MNDLGFDSDILAMLAKEYNDPITVLGLLSIPKPTPEEEQLFSQIAVKHQTGLKKLSKAFRVICDWQSGVCRGMRDDVEDGHIGNCCHDGGIACENNDHNGCINEENKTLHCQVSLCVPAQEELQNTNPKAYQIYISILKDIGMGTLERLRDQWMHSKHQAHMDNRM